MNTILSNKGQDQNWEENPEMFTNDLSSNIGTSNPSLSDYQITLPERIEVVIKALGTMIIEPQFETNQVTFVKEQIGAVQHPILEDNKREQVLNVLVELINQL